MPRRTADRRARPGTLAMQARGARDAGGTVSPQLRSATVLARERLFTRLETHRGGGVWLGAPAGYGKTLLAAGFLDRSTAATLWLRAEPADADPATFFTRLRSLALRSRLAPASIPKFTPEHYAAPARFARRFFAALFATLADSASVVLDELECLGSAAPALIGAAVQSVRERQLLICVSRDPLPDALAREHISGGIGVLAADELAMTLDETLALAGIHGDIVGPARAEEIHRLTRGWPAAVAWLVRTGHDLPPGGAIPATLSAYIGAEIYGAFDARGRRLLLQAAFVPEITSALERHWPAFAGAASLAADAARRGLLVSAESTGQYRLHPLFSEFLRHQATRELGHDAVGGIRRGAAEALLAAGRGEAALAAYLDLGAFDDAARVLTGLAPALFLDARMLVLQQWLLALPARVRANQPELDYWLGMSRLTASPAEAQRDLLAAYRGFRAHDNRPWLLRTLGMLAYSTFLSHLPERPLRAWLAEIRELDVEWGRLVSPEEQAELAIAISYPLFICEPSSADVPLWEERLLRALHAPIDGTLKARVAIVLGALYGLDFNPHRMVVLHDWLAPELARQGLSDFGEIVFTMIRLQEAIARADYDRAERVLEETLARAAACGIHFLENHHRVTMCHGRLARGDVDGAAALLAEVRASQQSPQPFDAWHAEILSAWIALYRGEPHAALEHADLSHAAAALIDAPECLAYAQASRCFCHVALNDLPSLGSALRILQDLLPRGRSQLARLMADGIEAIYASRTGDGPRMRLALERAMAIVRRYDFDRLPLLTPGFVGELALASLDAGIGVEYAQRLIRAFGVQPPAHRAVPDNWPWPLTLRALGHLRVTLDGKPLPTTRKAQRQPMLMLATLVANGGRDVPLALLAEQLHPRIQADSALARVEVTLHRLRRLLAVTDALVVRHGRISLNASVCDLDLWRLHTRLEQLDLAASRRAPQEIAQAADRLLDLYSGPLLEGFSDSMVHAARVRTHERVARSIAGAAAAVTAAGLSPGFLDRATTLHLA